MLILIERSEDGKKLQELLLRKAEKVRNGDLELAHWLEDWWDHTYLSGNESLLFANFYLHHDFYTPNTAHLTRRAAQMAAGALDFHRLLVK